MQIDKTTAGILATDPKSFFQDIESRRREILDDIDHLAKLRAAAVSLAITIGDGIGGGGLPQNKTENDMLKILELDNLIAIKVKAYNNQVKLGKLVLLSCVADPLDRTIIYRHYIKNQKWPEIAKALKITERGVYKNR